MDISSYLPASNLPLLAILIGAAMVGAHLFGLLAPDVCMPLARSFPRSRFCATVLLAIASIWFLAMTATMDLGEFSSMRRNFLIAIVAGTFLLWKFVPDFLSSRSVGFLLLLAAHPVLQTTFMKIGFLHFALAFLAYCWAFIGLFLVGMPYLQRDLIGWRCAEKWRWSFACWAGLLYGLLLLIDGAKIGIIG